MLKSPLVKEILKRQAQPGGPAGFNGCLKLEGASRQRLEEISRGSGAKRQTWQTQNERLAISRRPCFPQRGPAREREVRLRAVATAAAMLLFTTRLLS
jgi:hypothetical protein